jgi:hypothetical protein
MILQSFRSSAPNGNGVPLRAPYMSSMGLAYFPLVRGYAEIKLELSTIAALDLAR